MPQNLSTRPISSADPIDDPSTADWSSYPVDPVRGCDLEPTAEELEACAGSVIAAIRAAEEAGGVDGVDTRALSGAEPTEVLTSGAAESAFVVVGPGFRANAAELGDDQFSVTIGRLTLVLTRAEVEELADELICAVAKDDQDLADAAADEVASRALHGPGRMLLAGSGQVIAEGSSLFAVIEARFGARCTYHPGLTPVLGDVVGFDGSVLARVVWVSA